MRTVSLTEKACESTVALNIITVRPGRLSENLDGSSAMTHAYLLLAQADALPAEVKNFLETPLGMGAIVFALGVGVYFLAFVSGRVWRGLFAEAPKAPEHNLLERVGEYPHPPGKV